MTKTRRDFGRWRVLGLGFLIVAIALGSGAVWRRERSRRLESRRLELAQAREAMSDNRLGVAHQRLVRLAEQWTDDGEVLLLLGECEAARQRRDDPLATAPRRDDPLVTWAKIPPRSPYFARASLLSANHLINKGRYAPAEEVLNAALAMPDPTGRYDLERALSRLYRREGRRDDVRRMLRASWSRSPDPAGVLKELFLTDHSPTPAELLQDALTKADDEDDRVWLGRANYALLTARFAEAALWLDRCLKRRPEDPSVWQARLDLALATDDIPGFWTAVAHLPANRFDAGAVHSVRAWLSARCNDSSLERRELTALLKYAPGDTKALERLAILTIQAGDPRETRKLRLRKAEIDRAHDKLRRIVLDEAQMASRIDELAESSAVMGRTFDAQGWAILSEARARGPDGAPDHSATPGRTPFPVDLMARATALSSPFATLPAGSPAGSMLGDRLGDLRALAARAGQTTAATTVTSNTGDPPLAAALFVDDAESAGLRFIFDNGQTPQHQLPETMSGGVGLLDFDGDGWLDVYCVQGGAIHAPVEGQEKTTVAQGDRLFRNRGDGTFKDVTESSGIARIAWGRGYGLGVTVGDYDNDGHPDLFVTRLRTYALYRNRGDGTFEDVTVRAGLAGTRDNPSSAAFADFDNDGDLDLYVCHYMLWDPAHPRLCQNDKGGYFYCDPSKVEPAPDHVFRNDSGRFVDVTAVSGCAESNGRGLGVVAAYLDDDDLVDLYVANDGTANYFFRNLGNFHFEEVGLEAGVAGNAEGGYQAGMGVACGDLDGDGRADLIVTNFYGEGATLYQNLGQGLFADRSAASGLGLATRYLLGFGVAMVDVTNHGRSDVMITNGHVNDNRPYYRYAMPSRLYENRPDGRLVDISSQAGAPWDVLRVGRGLVAGDLDNDGLVDAVILAQNEPLAYLHNRTRQAGHHVTFRLEGTRSNRDGVGARITIKAGGRCQVAQRIGGGSYLSANDPRVHFGLGESSRIDHVKVRWPSGRIDSHADLPADSGYLLREGDPKAQPLVGYGSR
ncbi:MAG: FG-GAP-like repeat-containing protein [Isosphaerales bacterium]